MTLRYGAILRFETPDEFLSVDLSSGQEWESNQEFQQQVERIHGADYGMTGWGRASAPIAEAQETVRILAPNDTVDAMRNNLYRIGKGHLWKRAPDESERWAWARLQAMPSFTVSGGQIDRTPLIIPFIRLSDWYAASATVIEETLTESPETVNVTNDGMVETRNIVITLTANSAGGWSNPSIANTTSNETFTVNQIASSGDVLRVDVLNFRAERSTDGGTTWTDVTPSMFLANSQVSPLSLLPDDNVLVVSGVTDAALEIEFYSAWR